LDNGYHNNEIVAVSLLNIVAVGVFGGFGAMARFLMSNWASKFNLGGIPAGTLFVNGVGSLLLGLMLGSVLFTEGLSERYRLALTVGFLGGFTTFSTFSVETVQLFEQGRASAALMNIGLQVVVGLVMAGVGIWTARGVLG
jgi:fluoride exporter